MLADASLSGSLSRGSRRVGFTPWARRRRTMRISLIRLWRPTYPALLTLACAYLLAPTIVAMLASVSKTAFLTFPPQGLSTKWYQAFFARDDFVRSLVFSLVLGASVAVVAVLVGVVLAASIGRRSGVGRSSLTSLSYLPLILPTIVYGPALLIWAAKIHLTDGYWTTLLTLAAAHLILALPFSLQSIIVGYDGLDPSLEEAAMVLGARPRHVFRYVTLPLLMPSIIAGATFAFLTSFDEPIIALFLSRADLVTLPVQIYTYLRFKPDPTIAAIATVMILLSLLAVLIADRLVGLGKMMGLGR
jgi:putative spermidine/putrescine transport system permease protein